MIRHSDALRIVREHVSHMLEVDISDITPEALLLDLGAESFEFVDLVFRLERTFNVKLPRQFAIPEALTIDAFANAVVRALEQ